MRKIYLLPFALSIAFSCSRTEERGREVADLAEFPNTVFVPTMEHPLSQNKNAVYCATLLYAWDELKNTIGSPLRVDSTNRDLYLLNKSASYVKTLMKDEYATSVKIDGQEVGVGAKFEKSLPFGLRLTSFDDMLTFDGVKVASFGNFGEHPSGEATIEVLYYKNDNDFLIRLLPKDQDHEIYLYMTPTASQTLGAMVEQIKAKRKAGEAELQDGRMDWKFHLSERDVVIIPKIDFNIETHYPSLEGSSLSSPTSTYNLQESWQRIEFTLDEKGAEIESEAAVAVDSVGAVELPRPKKMLFDKPFFLMLKRTEAENPYFCLWVANSELMRKEDISEK